MSHSHEMRLLREEDLAGLLEDLSIAFGEVPAAAKDRIAAEIRSHLAVTLGSFEEGRLASSATMLPFEMYVGGVRQSVGGLASVQTAPWARRRGHVDGLLRAWFERLRQDAVGWCAEHPFDPRFYARYGFQSLPNGRSLEVPPSYFSGGRPPDAERLTGGDLAVLKPIHEAFARRYSFALTRDDHARDSWDHVARSWTGEERHAYLLEDAYLVFARFQDGTNELRVSDLAWSTPAGRERLGRFLRAFEGQVERVRIHLPPGDAVLLDAGARHAVRTPLVQVRLVDVAAALAPLTAPRPSHWRLALEDEACPWNRGVFAVALGPEGCSLEREDGPVDAKLHVRELAALLTGAAAPETLLADGRAEGEPQALHALAELMRPQPPFQTEIDGF